jgi:TetR/AcrR family transcriptional regulator, acrAB operon repressor
MARKTKEAAQATRSRLLDAAEEVFAARGVAGTSLAEIAEAAGLTRGAIYWHFEGKAELFDAMMRRVTLPLEAPGAIRGKRSAELTFADVRDSFVTMLRKLTNDPQARRVFDIATQKVEYVGEMNAVRERRLEMRNACLADLELACRRALRRGEMSRGTTPRTAAIGMVALFDGLLQNWMLDCEGFDLPRIGGRVFDAYLRGLTAPAA